MHYITHNIYSYTQKKHFDCKLYKTNENDYRNGLGNTSVNLPNAQLWNDTIT